MIALSYMQSQLSREVAVKLRVECRSICQMLVRLKASVRYDRVDL